MGKRRNTAKTGDKALYKSRQQPNESEHNVDENSDNDTMFSAVDRFHNRQDDFLKLDAGGSSSESEPDDGITGQEAVLDLGGAESSSSDDEDDEDSVNVESSLKGRAGKDAEASSSSSEDDSSDSEVDERLEQTDVRDWGGKKSSYYHGDTADLEIGQDEEDAYLEEEAAKEVEAARYEQMDEDDFLMSDGEEEKKTDKFHSDKKPFDMRGARDLSKLSKSDRRRVLQSHHPELLPLVSHFKHAVAEWDGRTRVAAKAVLEGDEGTIEAIGATPSGIQYLVSKALVQSSTALNVAMYLLLKSEQSIKEAETETDLMDVGNDAELAIQSHPVIARLQQLNKLAQKLDDRVENKVDTLSEQLGNLVKANSLMNDDQADTDSSSRGDGSEADESEQFEGVGGLVESEPVSKKNAHASMDSNSRSSDEEVDDDVVDSVMNEAKFGLRAQEIGTRRDNTNMHMRRSVPLDFGDDQDQESGLAKRATQSLASTINAIEQRSATRSRKKRRAVTTEDLDEQEASNDALSQGLKMMEAELGRLESDDEDMATEDAAIEGGTDEDEFYMIVKERSKAKKKRKASLYEVAPKYPGMDQEIQGERAISKTIMKNRGLVAHKSKLNRNPRVKKREQYRKALVRRKGHVRDVRTDEGHKYGGEETGIKSGLSRSRKLGR